jgi:light-regulated signal transduction histidine kinase (bacteriophytochrome)
MVFLCQRMERLVDDLLYFSRLGRQKLAVQPTDLNIVVKDIEAMLETTLHEQRAEIVVPRPLPTITCDAPRITEVFRNLITNAIKYNKSESKRIEVGCTNMVELVPESPDERVFYVRDNGIGIAPEFHREIFRIFKRLNDEDDTSRGSGVGLTFVQKIIERHNGRIWLDSDVGRGSTFYFTINAPQETAAG